MRNFRRLPPVLRVASILGLLFALASLVLFLGLLITILPSFPRWPVDAFRGLLIALNLGMLGGACSFAVNAYSIRFRRSDRESFPLDSWQSQVRAIVLLAALPIGALALAVVIPPTSLAFGVVFPISILGAIGLLVASLLMNSGRRALD
jgi:drug/metabolite transporter (DMT)-like permease